MKTAKLVTEITVVDPDSSGDVQLCVYKHENGGMFAIDSSYLEQNFYDIPDIFSDEPNKILLIE